MKDSEGFISRWSRRKREAVRETESAKAPTPSKAKTPADDDHAAALSPAPVEPSFDPASLPPIESITAETDIRGFLAPGVPSELTRAALRRTWASDPSIRNFVGLAEYDWDFNAPDAIAGFGPLSNAEEIGKIAARIIGPSPAETDTAQSAKSASATSQSEPAANRANPAAEPNEPKLRQDQPTKIVGAAHSQEIPYCADGVVATQNARAKSPESNHVVKRRHGGALPK